MSDLLERLRDGSQNEVMLAASEAADLLEFYQEQNAALLKRQDQLLAVVDAARFFVRLMQPQSTDADFLHDGLARKNALGQLEREIRALDGEP